MNKSYYLILPSISEPHAATPRGPSAAVFQYEQTATRNALVFCINSHVQCCSFNIYATIYEDLCCSRILKKACTYLVLR